MTQRERLAQYRRLLSRRRRLYVIAPVAGVFLLILLQGGFTGLPTVLTWPVLVLYAIAVTGLMQSLDQCPWCGRSFHNGPHAGTHGFSRLTRRQCANCGEPREPQ